jgi:hypothetical protein
MMILLDLSPRARIMKILGLSFSYIFGLVEIHMF